ncbi:hypothetical protein GCM10029992_14270 [Glycomyces albus]
MPTPRVESDPETRSSRYQRVARESLGLHADVRELFFMKLDPLLKEQGEALRVQDVLDQAITHTKEDGPEAFPRTGEHKLPRSQYPWRKLEGFALRALALAGLIEVDGEAMRDTGDPWTLRAGRFSEYDSDWITLVESQIVLAIIRGCDDVDWDSCVDLAGAMYLKRDDEYVRRVDAALESLRKRDLIELDGGTGRYREKTAPAQV